MFTDHPENAQVITDLQEYLILLELHIWIGFSHLGDTTSSSFPPNFCWLGDFTSCVYLWDVAFGKLRSDLCLPLITSKASVILTILTTCDCGSWPQGPWHMFTSRRSTALAVQGKTPLAICSKLSTSSRSAPWILSRFQRSVSIVAQTSVPDLAFSLYPCTNICLFWALIFILHEAVTPLHLA